MRALLLALLVPLSSYGAGKIVNADIAASGTANVARNKLAAGTAYAWCVNDVSGFQADTAVTASRAVATDANGAPVASATTATELGYVNGVTSAIQTQLNGKQAAGNYITALTGDGTAAGPGSAALTLATVNTNVGSFTNASVTVNAKGLVTAASSGTAPVTAVSVASANGFAGSSGGGTTPALTLSTTITGVLKGNGTAISAATSGTDYSAGTSALATGIVKTTTTTGALSIAAAGTDYQAPISTNAGSSHQFFTAFTAPNTFTLAQPAFTDISGTNAIGAGGTGQTTATAAFDALAPCSTQGDIAYYNGTHWVCLGVGTSGQFLKTLGAAANPVWSTGSYTPPTTQIYVSGIGGTTYGSSATRVVRFGNNNSPNLNNGGSDLSINTDTDAATNGTVITVNTAGNYCVQTGCSVSGGTCSIVITQNGSALTTGANAPLTFAQGARGPVGFSGANSGRASTSYCGQFSATDTIRAQADGSTLQNNAENILNVSRQN